MIDVDTVRLIAEADCRPCEGTGLIMSDDWRAFIEWRARRQPQPSPDAEDDLVEQFFLVVCNFDAVPAMSEECAGCDGSGKVRMLVTVREVLEMVVAHLERPLVSESELDGVVRRVKESITQAALRSDGLPDGMEVGTWLRAVQEGAEALRSLGELRAKPRNGRVI